jgi:hypothetical protein
MRTSSSRGTSSSVSITLLSMKPVEETTTHSTLRPETGMKSTALSTVSPMAGVTTIPTWLDSSESRCEAVPRSWSESVEPPRRVSWM